MKGVAILLICLTVFVAGTVILLFLRTVFVKKPTRTPKEAVQLSPERYAETLSEMIKFETVATKGQPTPFAEDFFAYVKQRFPEFIKACDFFEIESSFVIKWSGVESEKSTVLMAHYDVAPIKAEWSKHPFSGTIDDGKIFGRGAIDAKGTLCALLEACYKLFLEGFVPQNDIFILSTGNEEIDGGDIDKVVEQLSKMNVIPRLVIDEGSAICERVLQTEFRGARVSWSERSSCNFLLKADKIPSRQPSMDRIANFILKASSKKLLKANYPKEFRAMIDETLPYMELPQKILFKNSWLFKSVIKFFLPKVFVDANVMVYPTVAFQIPRDFDCNSLAFGENAIEGVLMCSAYSDFSKAMDKLHKLAVKCGVRIEITNIKKAPVAKYNIEQSYNIVKQSLEKTFDDVVVYPNILCGNTDSMAFDGQCDNILSFSPISLTESQFASIHYKDENINISALSDAVACYYNLMKQL